jgi:hypothetical protein
MVRRFTSGWQVSLAPLGALTSVQCVESPISLALIASTLRNQFIKGFQLENRGSTISKSLIPNR